jgi:hypothetical protein
VDLSTGTITDEPVGSLSGKLSPLGAFSPDGTRFVFSTTNQSSPPAMHVFDLASGKVSDLALAPDGQGPPAAWTASGIVSFTKVGMARIDPASGKTVATVPVPRGTFGFQLSADATALAVVSHTTALGDDNPDPKAQATHNTVSLVRGTSPPVILRTKAQHNIGVGAVAADGTVLVDDRPANEAGVSVGDTDHGFLLLRPDGSAVQLAPHQAGTWILAAKFRADGSLLMVVSDAITATTKASDQVSQHLLLYPPAGGAPTTVGTFTATPRAHLFVLG